MEGTETHSGPGRGTHPLLAHPRSSTDLLLTLPTPFPLVLDLSLDHHFEGSAHRDPFTGDPKPTVRGVDTLPLLSLWTEGPVVVRSIPRTRTDRTSPTIPNLRLDVSV